MPTKKPVLDIPVFDAVLTRWRQTHGGKPPVPGSPVFLTSSVVPFKPRPRRAPRTAKRALGTIQPKG